MSKTIRYNLKKIVVIITFLSFVMLSCRFYFNTTKDNITIDPAQISIANGKNLTYNVCGGCHYNAEVKKFIGRPLNDLPKIGGKLYSANLTQSKTDGIPVKYSDTELFYLLKTGIAKSGKFMPYMMKPMMADEDIKDIIAYLRSNDPAVTAADTTVGISHINFIGKTGIRIASKPQPYTKGIQRPDENNDTAYGRYVVAVVGCYLCHSKKVLGLDYSVPTRSKGYMEGGMKLKSVESKKIYSANLTPDKETGIGSYDLAAFTKAVREGINAEGKPLRPPMDKFSHLTDKQVKAIFAYLKTLTPVNHKVKNS